MCAEVHLPPHPFNSEDNHAVHVLHVLLDVTLSASVAGCFSSLLQCAPPMVGEAAVFLLSEFNDTVNCAVHCGTCSSWVVHVGSLWLIAWDIEVHENEISGLEQQCINSDTQDNCNEDDTCAGNNSESFISIHQHIC